MLLRSLISLSLGCFLCVHFGSFESLYITARFRMSEWEMDVFVLGLFRVFITCRNRNDCVIKMSCQWLWLNNVRDWPIYVGIPRPSLLMTQKPADTEGIPKHLCLSYTFCVRGFLRVKCNTYRQIGKKIICSFFFSLFFYSTVRKPRT